jgi:hypothetical protein
MFYHRKTAD